MHCRAVVETSVKPDTQSWLGVVARNCLFTRSNGHGRALSIARQVICKANLPKGGPSRLDLLAAPDTFDPNVPHQTFNRAAGDIKLLTFHCMPKLARTIDRQIIIPDTLHLWTQFNVLLGAI